MTKEQLQAELKDKVKPGVKPSKLKRSKSLGDIPSAPPLPLQKDDQKTITLLQAENAELLKELKETQTLLDKSNEARYEALKKPTNPRVAELEAELNQTVTDATEEITRQENEIKQLQTKLTQITNQNQDLIRQENIYQRAAELRINEPSKEPISNFWNDYGMIILLLGTYCLSAWLLRNNYQKRN